MKALVIGASGHIGSAIVRALLDRGDEVTACGRRTTPPANLEGLPISYVPGDAETPGQLDKWIEGHQLVVEAAAPYPLGVFTVGIGTGSDPIFAAERRTRALRTAVSRHNARLIFVSSCVTLARPRTAAQQMHDRRIRMAHPYFEVKELTESQIVDAAQRGLPAVIVNPTYCLGPWDLRDRMLCTIPPVLRGEIPISINQMLNVIDVRDVAAASLAALDKERYGKPILLGAHDILTNDLYSLICEVGGVSPPPRYSVPPSWAIVGSYFMELTFGVMGRKPILPSGGMMMATTFDYLDRTDSLRELGVAPHPLSQTIADAIRWYRQIKYC
jgi:dihydroflavonol-4-reductase